MYEPQHTPQGIVETPWDGAYVNKPLVRPMTTLLLLRRVHQSVGVGDCRYHDYNGVDGSDVLKHFVSSTFQVFASPVSAKARVEDGKLAKPINIIK